MSDTEGEIVDIDDEPEETGPETDVEGEDEIGDEDEGKPVEEPPRGPTKTVEVLVDPANYRTPDVVSVYEQTELISVRGTQIADFNNPIEDYPGCKTEMEIARKELAARKCPLLIRREVGKRVIGDTLYIYVEMRNPNEMILTLPLQ